MSKEKPYTNAVLLAAAEIGARLFRQNVGLGWIGKATVTRKRVGQTHVVIPDARPLHAGICKGSSDTLGWRSITITPEHVGCKLAVFCALEVKTPGVPLTAEQEAFLGAVTEAGGIAAVIDEPTPADAAEQAKFVLLALSGK